MLIKGMSDDASPLVELAAKLDDGPVLASVLHEFGQRPGLAADDLLLKKLGSDKPIVRSEAIRTLARRKNKAALDHIERLLLDPDANVILAAVMAAGQLGAVRTTDTLLEFTRGRDRTLITASLDSLRKLQDNRAVNVALSALDHQETQAAAIEYLTAFGTPDQIDVVVEAAARNPASDIQSKAVRALSTWQTHFADARERTQAAISTVHGNSGQPLAWHVSGPLSTAAADESLEELRTTTGISLNLSGNTSAATVIAEGSPPALSFNETADDNSVWLAWTTIRVNRPTNIELLTSATGRLSLWMPGGEIHAREKPGQFLPDSDRIPVRLESGTSLLVARIEPDGGDAARFHLRFRRRSSKAEHERLIAHALKTDGNVDRGRKVFANVEKSSCIRCHQMGIEGGRIGPDLTGIGSRFSRIHLIESILEPSRTVAPSYTTIVVALEDGKVMTGIRVSESDKMLVIGDNQGKLHEIAVANVEEIATQTVSTMPEGLEKKLTDREFTDLLAFLESETSARSK
jgi:putative heme-binding domain-containing protein